MKINPTTHIYCRKCGQEFEENTEKLLELVVEGFIYSCFECEKKENEKFRKRLRKNLNGKA